jgi:Mg2+-importing ATPase
MKFIRNFMLAVGPVSSMFDFLTFYVLLKVLSADAPLFHTGWFIESLSTQVLVIFVIRTRLNPFASHPHPLLTATSLLVVAVGAILPFTSLGPMLGFVAPPIRFFVILGGMVIAYLGLVEIIKRWFYRLSPTEN